MRLRLSIGRHDERLVCAEATIRVLILPDVPLRYPRFCAEVRPGGVRDEEKYLGPFDEPMAYAPTAPLAICLAALKAVGA